MGFGLIKENLTTKLLENLSKEDKDFNKVYHNYLANIGKEPILMLEYLAFTYLTSTNFKNKVDAERYLNENLKAFSKFKKNDIKKLNKRLEETFLNFNDITNNVLLLESIQELIYINSDTKFYDVNKKHKLENVVIEHLTRIPKSDEFILNEDYNGFSLKQIMPLLNKKIDEKVSKLNEDEQKIVKAYFNSDINELNNLFEEYKKTAIIFINNNYTDLELINEATDKIEKMTYCEENLIEISELIS